MQTKFLMTCMCLTFAGASIFMIFFGETFSTATVFQQRGTIMLALVASYGTYYFGKQVFEFE